jgi:hypothetical protein
MRALHAGVAKFSFKIARHKLVLRKLWLSLIVRILSRSIRDQTTWQCSRPSFSCTTTARGWPVNPRSFSSRSIACMRCSGGKRSSARVLIDA